MDFEKMVNEEMKKLVESGTVEVMIQKKLTDTIGRLVCDCLETYSDFGKALRAKVMASMDLKGVNMDLPSYGQTMCNMIEDIVANGSMPEVVKKMEENLKRIFIPLEKSEWKLSEIITKFVESISKEDYDSGEISMHVEKSESSVLGEYWYVYFDEEEGVEKYRCKYRLNINKDGVWGANIDGTDSKKMKMNPIGGFDSFMFNLVACNAKIENDEEYCQTSYGRD